MEKGYLKDMDGSEAVYWGLKKSRFEIYNPLANFFYRQDKYRRRGWEVSLIRVCQTELLLI